MGLAGRHPPRISRVATRNAPSATVTDRQGCDALGAPPGRPDDEQEDGGEVVGGLEGDLNVVDHQDHQQGGMPTATTRTKTPAVPEKVCPAT